ncbi:MAG: hypothetical protein R3B90_10265 [Planctomycetaceae bacterium]
MPESRTSWRPIALLLMLISSGPGIVGCARLPVIRGNSAPMPNPLTVQAGNDEVLWERTIDVLHEYHFSIERENRVAGVIETAPLVGASLLEPWHKDSVGFVSRLESSLQSVQRKVVVTFIPADGVGETGRYQILIQVFKEREDVRSAEVVSPGGATFLESDPLAINLDPTVAPADGRQMIQLGRDAVLEQALLDSLRRAFSR